MNKRGFIRILEAIIALIVVLGYVVSILPKAQQPSGKVPPELEAIQKAVIDEVKTDEKFRTCVVYGQITYEEKDMATNEGTVLSKDDVTCINEVITQALPPFSLWRYAFALCHQNATKQQVCEYLPREVRNAGGADVTITNDEVFSALALPASGAVYSKSIFLSVPDVTTSFYTEGQKPASANDGYKAKVLRLYLWSSV